MLRQLKFNPRFFPGVPAAFILQGTDQSFPTHLYGYGVITPEIQLPHNRKLLQRLR